MKSTGLNRLLRFEPQPDSLDSIFYNFQTAERPQRFICLQCDVTFKPQPEPQPEPQPDRSSLYISKGDITQTAAVRIAAICLGHTGVPREYSLTAAIKLTMYIQIAWNFTISFTVINLMVLN